MGLVPSSLSVSTSYSVAFKETRVSKSASFESPNPSSPPTAITPAFTTVSVKLSKRHAWYHRLKRGAPVSERKAKKSALIVRSLIVGNPDAASPKLTKAAARPQLIKIKSHLVEPKSANRIIAQLRALPMSGDGAITNVADTSCHKYATGTSIPIHAVCLEHPDVEAHQLYFSKFTEGEDTTLNLASYSNKFMEMINAIHVIDLIKSPDLGIGQPGDGPGVLAGALPTPETVIKGIQQITPQLMALGYAVGNSVLPDHKGVFPPTDRMSLLTYWWGLELVLPPPSLAYLASVHSVSGAVMNFLTALSLINNGIREILPFIRYISQFVDFEFNQIKSKDQGKGVVCAATWIMPAALVPRPWDFPDPPIPSINPPKGEDEFKGSPGTKPKPAPSPKPSPADGLPFLTPAPVASILDTADTSTSEAT